MKKYLLLTFAFLLLMGCKQEVLEPEQMIEGKFALDDGSGLTDEYLEFANGHLNIYEAPLFPFAEGKIWHTDGWEFMNTHDDNYTISEGNIYTSSTLSGPIALKDGILTVGGKKYAAMEGFEAKSYSKIVAESEVTFPYTDQDFSIPYSIERPIPAGDAGVSTNNSQWITNLKVEDGAITGHLSATSANRSGSIKLSYTHATDVWVTVMQAPTTFIRPTPESLTLKYTASTQTLDYTIENPVATSTLTANSTVSWISDLQVSGTQISFNVSENNTGANRSGSITLRYVGAPDVSVPVTQKWSASNITMAPSSQTVDYTGGSFSFDYAICNPREGMLVTVASQVNWITNVAVSGNTISYQVAENNSGAQRTGKIKLTYGNYASAEFPVTQSWTASSITMTPSSQTADYTGGSFNFSYAISNPRANTTVTAASQVNWITNVAVSGNSISYKVAENNSGTQRSGKIKLTYGNYATAEFTVAQTGKPVMSLTLNRSELALLTGASETLIATVDPTDAPLQWSSNKTSVATVDQNGKVTAVSNGTATISVIAGEKTAQCTVTVTTAVKAVSLNKTTLNLNVGKSETLVATITPSTASNQSVTWTSSNTSAAKVDHSGKVEAIANGTALITVETVDGGETATCMVTVTTAVTGIYLNKTTLDLPLDQSETLVVTFIPTTASNKSLIWSSNNLNIATVDQDGTVYARAEGTTKIIVKSVDGNKTATCTVNATTAVDLGLSVKWRMYNLGASSIDDYGNYYAWGETTTKSNYAWSTYKWCKKSETTMTKYCTDSSYGTVDNITELQRGEKTGETVDDAARAILGEKWRMPTIEEFRELLNNCSISRSIFNGVWGVKCTSRIEGYSDRWIFLPSAAYWTDDALNTNALYNHWGSYWSSSLSPTSNEAYRFLFNSEYGDKICPQGYRRMGNTVRPVCDK